jgi:[acyl-carrier-protein] S-malonyltransferase
MDTAFIFPGQGSQTVGMGRDLAEASATARALFEEVDDALHQKLSQLMFNGPDDQLTLTTNAQPAIMSASIAVLRVLEIEGGIRLAEKAAFVAGHSLGEYSALAAAEALAAADTARLLRIRGDAMQAAVPPGVGAMAAILGLGLEAVVAVAAAAAADGEVVAVANDNAPGQVVLSGHAAAVERAIGLAKAAGARRAMALAVSAPFHCPLMQPAADLMERTLAGARIAAPLVPLVANVTAEVVAAPDEIRALLGRQVTATVRWRQSVERLAALGVSRFVELGGKVLGPMVKRIVPDATVISIQTMDDIEKAAAVL